MLRKIWAYGLTGLMFIAPWAITAWVVWLVYSYLAAVTQPVVQAIFGPNVPGIVGPILGLAALVFLGWFVNRRLVRWFVGLCEEILKKFPIVGIIFKMSKDTVDALNLTTDTARFTRVVFIQGFRQGVEVLGFVTSEVRLDNGRKLLSVFVPTTPIPTSGQLFLVHEDQSDVVRDADMTVEEGLKAILSGGFTFASVGHARSAAADGRADEGSRTEAENAGDEAPPPVQ